MGRGDHPPYSICYGIWQAPFSCGSTELPRYILYFGRPPTALSPTLATRQSCALGHEPFRSSPYTFAEPLLPGSGSKWNK
jgi:hypothetical protein